MSKKGGKWKRSKKHEEVYLLRCKKAFYPQKIASIVYIFA